MTRLPSDYAGVANTRGRPVCHKPARPCASKGCQRMAARNRTICNTCRDRLWREKHPEHHLWNNLKKSARRRGHAFTITFEWFYCWCEMTGFVEMVGREKGCASIDRIKPWRGYEPDNIGILEVGANSAKGQNPPPINSEDGDIPW